MSSFDLFDDQRSHPPKGHSRSFRLPKVTLPGGGYISKGEDGRVAVAGRESLRILRVSDSQVEPKPISSTKNLWDGSGLKIDCASTDVAWAYGVFNNKILTSARNGELIMWDITKNAHSKFERRTKEHLRSIHTMSVSRIVHHYCMTGSADGDFRVWDLRDIQASVMRVHNPSAVRRVIFSPCFWNPLFVLVGMDSGTLHRWDLKMGQRGLLDRLPVAHTAPITTIDWYSGGAEDSSTTPAISFSGHHHQATDDYTGNTLGWVASAGLDRCVKVWDLTGPEAASRMPNKPTYTLHPSYPIRRILWRPGYECELAVVSHADFTVSSHHIEHFHPGSPSPGGGGPSSGLQSRAGSGLGLDTMLRNLSDFKLMSKEPKSLSLSSISLSEQQQGSSSTNPMLDAVEIWDVRRSWLPKWSVSGTSMEGGVTDIEFADPYTLLAQNTNGTFTQLDMRDTSKPLDAIPRTSTTWTPNGALAFVTDNAPRWEIPYDDIHPSKLNHEIMALTKSPPIKHIGGRSFRPKTQKLGVFNSPQMQMDSESFTMLAVSYVIEGDDASTLCVRNMEAALAVGRPHIAQLWMLMSTLLTKSLPPPLQSTMTKSPLATPQDSPLLRMSRVASLGNIAAAARQQQQLQQLHQKQQHQKQQHHYHVHVHPHQGPLTPTQTATHTPVSAPALASYTFPPSANTPTPPSVGVSANASRSPDTSKAPRPSPSYHFPPVPHSASARLHGAATGSAGIYRSPSVSQKPTPASSNSSSPLHLTTTLPPIVNNSNVVVGTPMSRRTSGLTSGLGKRQSIDSGVGDSPVVTIPGTSVAARKSASVNLLGRRQSISVSASGRQQQQYYSTSPSEKNPSAMASVSIKHIGEGVLSDSDSEEEEGEEQEEPDTDDERDDDHEEEDEDEDEQTTVIGYGGSGTGLSLLFLNNDEGLVSSPAGIGMTTPSPLYRRISQKERERARRRWITAPEVTGGGGEAYYAHSSNSPSPGSTDTERDGDEGVEEDEVNPKSSTITSLANRRTSFRRGRGAEVRRSSRSSTLASLSAGHAAAQAQVKAQIQAPPALLKRGSQGSTKTITAVEVTSGGGPIEHLIAPDTRDEGESHQPTVSTSTSRHRSTGKQQQKLSDFDYHYQVHLQEVAKAAKAEKVTKRRTETVREQEERMESYVWEVVKEGFEELLVVGDVQTAATMAVIAPKELELSTKRRVHIFDTYVDQLFRCQLYTTAAYFRKHSQVQQIKNMTLLDTTIYTLCGRCKKPLLKPTGHSLDNPGKRPTYSYCLGCKAPTVRCAICRLPVRTLLFQCSICHHGGHQSCYRQFYLNQPMVDIPPFTLGQYHRGRPAARTPSKDLPSPAIPGMESQLVRAAELAGHPCAAGCGHYCWATLKV